MSQLVAANFRDKIAYTDDGLALPIVGWIDEDGDRAYDWKGADRFVVLFGTQQIIGRICDFEPVTIN